MNKHVSVIMLLAFAEILFVGQKASAANPNRTTPRPAIARIIVPEGKGVTSFGSGTLIDVREEYGLVITNWHVVRDAKGLVEVVFPSGFRSHARPLKMDKDWDLAALVIWQPPIKPIPIAQAAPQPGDVLTICGYGQGSYREATGRCTQYLAPGVEFPREMVELNVVARQGDSGGPIFNQKGELAGVLFGATSGTTLGSFGGRVDQFLASLAPDIGTTGSTKTAIAQLQPVPSEPIQELLPEQPSENIAQPPWQSSQNEIASNGFPEETEATQTLTPLAEGDRGSSFQEESDGQPALSPLDSTNGIVYSGDQHRPPLAALPTPSMDNQAVTWEDIAGQSWFQQSKTVLAFFGLAAILLKFVRWAA